MSPVASTPKIALDKSVHIRELKCAVCGGPFTDADIENSNGQWSHTPPRIHSLPIPQSTPHRLTHPFSFLLHSVRWAAHNDDDMASPRSPGTEDSVHSAEGGATGPQYAHSSCAQSTEK